MLDMIIDRLKSKSTQEKQEKEGFMVIFPVIVT